MQLSYQGKEDCRNPTCTRLWNGDEMADRGCIGHHCATCDEPSSMLGHKKCREEAEQKQAAAGAAT